MPDNNPRVRERVRPLSAADSAVPASTEPSPRAAASTSGAAPKVALNQNDDAASLATSASTPAAVPVPAAVPPATPARGAAYEVGYRKPPKGSQFQPGRSGNPNGRPKHAKNARTIVTEFFERIVDVGGPGGGKKMSLREAGFQQIGKRAVEKGDLKSFAFLLDVEGGGLGSPSSARHTRSASNVDSDSFAIEPSALELEILAFAHRERLRESGFGEKEIDMVLTSLGLLPAIPAIGPSAPAIAAGNHGGADTVEEA